MGIRTAGARRVRRMAAALALAAAFGAPSLYGRQLPPDMTTANGRPADEGFPHFRDITATSGVDFVLDAGNPVRWYILESNSAGVIVIDYDNDGLPDLYFVNGSTPDRLARHEPGRGNRLYRNLGGGRFADVTAKARVGGTGAWGMGGCVADVDNNGYDDLFVTNYGPDVLYLNNGDGTFRDVSAASGVAGGDRWHSGCAFGDYDGDGDVDLYVSVYAEFSFDKERSKPPYTTARPGLPMSIPGPEHYPTAPHEFYENVGGGRFVDAAAKAGIANARPGHGFGVVWGDFDNDGDQDIYVANDLTPNHLFVNNGNKTFTDQAVPMGVALDAFGRRQASMGVDSGDYDNDGDLDLIVTNYALDHTTLYRNDGGVFTDISSRARLTATRDMGWGVQFVDLNLDALLDVVEIHGHLDPVMDRPVSKSVAAEIGFHAEKAGYAQWSAVRRNRANAFEFIMPGRLGDLFREPHVGRGLALADLDTNGQMDLVVSNQDERPSIFLNEGVPGNWAMFKLRGTRSNRSAIGARVTVRAGGVTQMREVKSGGSYLSQSDLRLHFGLGPAKTLDEVTIRWPSGRVQTLRGLPSNRLHVVREQ